MRYTNRFPGNKVTASRLWWCPELRAHLWRPASTAAALGHRDWPGKRPSPPRSPLMCAALSRTCPGGLIINQDFLLAGVRGRGLSRLRQSRG